MPAIEQAADLLLRHGSCLCSLPPAPQAYRELSDFWQLSVTLEAMAPCLDFSSAGGGLGALAQARAQLLWEAMVQGVRQAVLARGSQAVMEAGALTFAFQEGSSSRQEAAAAGSKKRKASDDGADAAASTSNLASSEHADATAAAAAARPAVGQHPAVHMLCCAALEKAVYPRLVDQEGGRKLDLSPEPASSSSSSNYSLELTAQLPADAPPAQLYTCGGSSQPEEVPTEQLPQRLDARQHTPAPSVLAQLRQLAEAAGYQLHVGKVSLRVAAASQPGQQGHQQQQRRQQAAAPAGTPLFLAFLTWAAEPSEGPGGCGSSSHAAEVQLRAARAVLGRLDVLAQRIAQQSDMQREELSELWATL